MGGQGGGSSLTHAMGLPPGITSLSQCFAQSRARDFDPAYITAGREGAGRVEGPQLLCVWSGSDAAIVLLLVLLTTQACWDYPCSSCSGEASAGDGRRRRTRSRCLLGWCGSGGGSCCRPSWCSSGDRPVT